jgi:hypothetical protein
MGTQPLDKTGSCYDTVAYDTNSGDIAFDHGTILQVGDDCFGDGLEKQLAVFTAGKWQGTFMCRLEQCVQARSH